MVGKLETTNRDLLVRRCVGCGYDGALLMNGRAERCARCGCDLSRRPARSYAEMEGLVEPPPRPLARRVSDLEPAGHLQSWLAFLFFALIGLLVMVSLVAAALP